MSVRILRTPQKECRRCRTVVLHQYAILQISSLLGPLQSAPFINGFPGGPQSDWWVGNWNIPRQSL